MPTHAAFLRSVLRR